MNRVGPDLEWLMGRLAQTPADFLAEPRIGTRGMVHVDAVIADLAGLLGGSPPAPEPKAAPAERDRKRLGLALVLCWLYADAWVRDAGLSAADVLRALDDIATELAQSATAQRYVNDPERREELARTALARLDHRPRGETVAQAQDRLTALSATERARVVEAARAAEQRSRAIREALARKAAEESADKYTRE